MKLTAEQARGLAWYGPRYGPELGLMVVRNSCIGSRRWVSEHVLVVLDKDGKYWEATYEKGLTEVQDTRPFEYEAESGYEVEFYQVERVPVTTYEYRPLKTVEIHAHGEAEPVGEAWV